MVRGLFFVGLLVGYANWGLAQSEFSTAIRVNQSSITQYEIEQRISLMTALGVAGHNGGSVCGDSVAARVAVEQFIRARYRPNGTSD